MAETGSASATKRNLLLGTIIKLVLLAIIMGLVLLLPAGKTHYWQAWIYLALLLGSMTAILAFLYTKDPELLERRMRTNERERTQKRLRALFTPVFLAVWVIPGFDIRWNWSSVPVWLIILADVLFLLGYYCFFLVLRANSYAARTIGVDRGQSVISTGPYAVVRHPMYTAILGIYLTTPLALGSYWALLAALPLPFVLALRIRNEEAVLLRELPGYDAYRNKTKYRLIPLIW
jgi:protein-S-isoprenylcysteine O-methyltransferase Ste14